MGRAYRNCEAGIAGIRYRAHVRRALALSRIAAYNTVAAVAGRHDDADARAYEPVYLDTQRTLAGGEPFGIERISEAEIDPMNLEAAPIVVAALNVAERSQEVAEIAGLTVSQHLQADELAVARQSGNRLGVLAINRFDVAAIVAHLCLDGYSRDSSENTRLIVLLPAGKSGDDAGDMSSVSTLIG